MALPEAGIRQLSFEYAFLPISACATAGTFFPFALSFAAYVIVEQSNK
jgi:hypothetical protein